MNKNNLMYNMFKEMMAGYKENNSVMIEHGAQCWLDQNPDNPFPEESPEHETFFQMQRCYLIWKRGDVDRKINRRRMMQWALRLCELKPKQPYRFDKKADEEDKAEAARREEEIQKAAEAKQIMEKETKKNIEIEEGQKLRVLGVVPEEADEPEKKGFLSKLKGLFKKK